MAQAATLAALHDRDHIERAVNNNSEQAEVLTPGLNKFGYVVPIIWANFLFCELDENAAGFAERLLSQGIVVQPLGLWGAPTAIRISIGTPEQNQALLKLLENLRSA